MPIIYEKTPGALMPTAGRTVTSYPSGLLRIDRTYICATTAAATHRATLTDESPMHGDESSAALDGLFIHPAASEVERGDGFTEFHVSGYGRTKSVSSGMILNPVPRYGSPPIPANGIYPLERWQIRYTLFEASGTIVADTNDDFGYDGVNLPDDILTPFDVRLERLGPPVIDAGTSMVSTAYDGWGLVSILPTDDPVALAVTSQSGTQGAILGFGPDGKPFRLGMPTRQTGTAEVNLSIPILAYRAKFSKEGQIDREFVIWTHAPQVTVSNRSTFGRFEEITFTSTRASNHRATEVLP